MNATHRMKNSGEVLELPLVVIIWIFSFFHILIINYFFWNAVFDVRLDFSNTESSLESLVQIILVFIFFVGAFPLPIISFIKTTASYRRNEYWFVLGWSFAPIASFGVLMFLSLMASLLFGGP